MKKFNLKSWRVKHGLTQSETGSLIHRHRNSVGNIEKSQELGLPVKNIHLIAAYCYDYDRKKATK